MNTCRPDPSRAARPSWWLAFCLAATLVAGCAGQGGLSSEPRNDIATASDQTEARKRAVIRLQLAAGYLERGQATVALDEIKQAIAIDPTFADAYNVRALIYMNLGDHRLAEDSFKRAISIAPRDGNAMQNYGWMLCQDQRYSEAIQYFRQAVAIPSYPEQAKTYMTMGICQGRAGQAAESERSLLHSFELDAGNPITGQELAKINMARNDFTRAQFYMRRINNSELATAASLWLGMKVERRLDNRDGVLQLGQQLKRRFPTSREAAAYDRGAWNE
jgi:type IV pilus assembly protein PilF